MRLISGKWGVEDANGYFCPTYTYQSRPKQEQEDFFEGGTCFSKDEFNNQGHEGKHGSGKCIIKRCPVNFLVQKGSKVGDE